MYLSPSHSTVAVFEIQVLCTSAKKKCQGDFGIFQFASAIRQRKKLPNTQKNLFNLRQQWVWHTLAFCQEL